MNKFLNAEEYNTIVLAITNSADYYCYSKYEKKEFYKTLFDKLFTIQENDFLKKEEINYPLKANS